jgi:hypothetical protein
MVVEQLVWVLMQVLVQSGRGVRVLVQVLVEVQSG